MTGFLGADPEQLIPQGRMMQQVGQRLGSGGQDLFRHAAQQDAVSSADGSVDGARYAELLGGEPWSDIINWSQDAWAETPFDDPMTIDEQAAINHLGPDDESVIADTPEAGLELVTGADAGSSDILSWNGQPSIEQLETALDEGRPITVMTDPIMPFDGDLSKAHVYQVTGVDTEDGMVVLSNPWGDGASMPGEVRVPLDVFYGN